MIESSPAPTGPSPESTGDPALDELLHRFVGSVVELAEYDLGALVRLDGPSTGLHAAARVVEAGRRAIGAFDTAYISALESGDEPARYAATSTTTFLRDQLRIGIGEARRRVNLAHACAPRPSFSGPPLPPRRPALAAAIAAGQVSAEHAGVVVSVLDALPDQVAETDGPFCEIQLVDAARVSDPGRLAKFGIQLLDRVDPDGALRDYDYAHARRSLTITAHRGRAGGRISGELDVELLEKLQTILEPLARPVPADPDAGPDALPDLRPPDVRRHDALLDVADRILASGELPASGGTPATVLFLVPEDADHHDRRSMATTEHGHRVPVPDALAMADNATIYHLINDWRDVPLALGRTTRLATPGQTMALAARDRGCAFPGCDRPPSWTQRHHIQDWVHGGHTTIDNLVLLCGHHHRQFARRGWTITSVDGVPWFVPPAWIDPQRTPIRNHVHHAPTSPAPPAVAAPAGSPTAAPAVAAPPGSPTAAPPGPATGPPPARPG